MSHRLPRFFYQVDIPPKAPSKEDRVMIVWGETPVKHLILNYEEKNEKKGTMLIFTHPPGSSDDSWSERPGTDIIYITQKMWVDSFGDWIPVYKVAWGEKCLTMLNIEEYRDLNQEISLLEQQQTILKNDQVAVAAVKEGIEQLEKFKKKFVKWFIDQKVKIPSDEKKTVQTIESNIVEQKPISEKQSSFKLKSKEAFELLINLENDKYIFSPKEENILGHDSFKRYQSDYIKKLIGDTFDSAFAELDKQGTLTHDKFFQITSPRSDWYKPRYVESFNYHCTNRKDGKYYERCKKRTFKKDSNIRGEDGRKIAFTLR